MFALLAAVSISQAPNLAADRRLDALVSYTTSGQALSQALSDLHQSPRLALSVAGPFDEDIVALRFEKVPLREAMLRLSKELKLEWWTTDKGYQLYQTPERAQQAGKELQIERTGRLRTWRQEHRERFKLPRPDFDDLQRRLTEERAEPMPDPNKNWAVYEERGKAMEALRIDGDPSNWFASAVISGITDEQLEEILDSGSVTFATNPNRLQQRLPKGAGPDLQAWARRKNITDYSATVRVRMVDWAQVKVSVNLEGTLRDSNEFFMPLNDPLLPMNGREPKGSTLDRELEIEGYLGMRWGMQNSRMPSEAVLQLMAESITDPDKREPLSTMAGAGLVEIAEETSNNLVALLADDMINLGSQNALPTNGRKLLAQFCDDVRATYTEGDGWLTVRPVELTLSRAKQFPRKYFRQVANATARERLLSFADVARIVSECTDLQLEGRYFRDYLTRKAARQEFTVLRTWGDTSVFRFWNSLSKAELHSVLGGGIPIGRLDPISKNLLWRAVSLGGTTMSGEGAFSQVYKGPIGNDPTKVFPNGFPPDEVLEAYTKTDDCVLSSFTPWRKPIWVAQSIEKFADYAGPNKADLTKIRLGKSQHVSIVIDKLTWTANVREDFFDFSRPMIDWKDVPQSFHDRLERAKRNPQPAGIIIR
jgi:hypothetical protein